MDAPLRGADVDVNELFNLIREGEGERAEFKVTFPEQAHDLAKDMVAFANSGGGIVLLGVTDDGEPVGITEPNKALERLANIARSCSPPLCPR